MDSTRTRNTVHLTTGYLFRPIIQNIVRDKPLDYQAIYARFKYYLNKLGIDEGKTPHSLRGGCAVSLQVMNSSGLSGIMSHVGWFYESSTKHYARTDKIQQASTLAKAMANQSWSKVEARYVE